MPVKPTNADLGVRNTDDFENWAEDSTKIREPSNEFKTQGWVHAIPTLQNFNWLFNSISKWLNYFEELTDRLSNTDYVDVLISDDPSAHYSTLQEALAAEGNDKIFKIDKSQTLSSSIVVSNNNVELLFTPRANFSKASVDLEKGFSITGNEVIIDGLNISGFGGTTLGQPEKAISFETGANQCVVRNSKFVDCNIDIEDRGMDNQSFNNLHTWHSNQINNNQSPIRQIDGLGGFFGTSHASIRFKFQIYRRTDDVSEQEDGFLDIIYNQASSSFSIRRTSFGDGEAGVNFDFQQNRLFYGSTNLSGANYEGRIRMRYDGYLTN